MPDAYSWFSLLVIYWWSRLAYSWSTRGLYKNQYHHTITMRIENSDTTRISTTPSTTSITIQDKYVASYYSTN
eukprot:scaffold226569_cov67-Attheya_sp.AAC.1